MSGSALGSLFAQDIAQAWLTDFSRSLSTGDCQTATSAFLKEGWLRDILVFTWSNRSLFGTSKIMKYLEENLKRDTLSDFRLNDESHLAPYNNQSLPTAVSSGFTFRTPIAFGQGFVNLSQDESGNWKALTVLMMMKDLIGHEESGPEEGVYEGHTRAWVDVNEERRKAVEETPHVIILGGGQTGLNVAARFHQMKIPSIVLEREDRIGDHWRKRYPTLSLHTPKNHHSMLYKPYPATWPIFTPRDKLASWLEQYADSQDLVIWTRSTILPTPKYDYTSKKWTVVVSRNGEHLTFHPAHIVIACGTLGHPRIPSIINMQTFEGHIIHSAKYNGGNVFSGKQVVVVGAGNTAADICQDLVHCGAEVTMVQRSSTCVVPRPVSTANLDRMWPQEVPTDVSDLKFASLPLPLIYKLATSRAAHIAEITQSMQDGLKKAGMQVNLGPGGAGNFILVFNRFGGYWLDVGAAELIISGKIKIKQGVEPERLTKYSMIFNDGSSVQADAIIFATGYYYIRDIMKDTFGEETIELTAPVWGLDEEGEIQGSYRPSGHPGLWFAAGDFFSSRFSSKQLALEIKAIELGFMSL
ncbi:FAD/NAD-P-binding domain-containing protein [Lentinula edodes]|uniref:FAD/NAD-P-binding domain-containing protein n=1 Tax=Lentinula edodes TaxID=5353 RepID=UPI001E8E2A1C|nr:FAD/NAD-P-binding domain-containing protein [Lentinula edodes]KAH7881049.1 FAD/NAD-P-binding domain-containing protein [Lentinula edodes]